MNAFVRKGKTLKNIDIMVSGYKHAASLVMIAAMVRNLDCTIGNIPDILDTRVLLRFMKQRGHEPQYENHILKIKKCENGMVEVDKQNAGMIHRAVRENIKLYSLSVSDRFSDLGFVGAIEVEGNTLTLFSLSCRALGREIESKLLAFVADRYQIHKIEFKTTGKNEDIKLIFEQSFPNAIYINCENG